MTQLWQAGDFWVIVSNLLQCNKKALAIALQVPKIQPMLHCNKFVRPRPVKAQSS